MSTFRKGFHNYVENVQYKFGKQGGGDGEFNHPHCLSVNKLGHLMVPRDSGNNRIQVFQLQVFPCG